MTEGAPIRSIEPARVAGGLGERVLSSARDAVDDDKEIVAFALVALRADGRAYVDARTQWPEDMPCNRHMFIGMATELIRDAMITEDTAIDVVNRANGFED